MTQCGSLGLCEVGPNLVIYPEGTWYSRVTPDDVAEILTRHVEGAGPLERLAWRDAAEIRTAILETRAKAQRPLQVAPDPGRRPG